MMDARGGVECDVGWAGDGGAGDCWEDPADAPGPAYFAEMFPGTFRPLALILKVCGFPKVFAVLAGCVTSLASGTCVVACRRVAQLLMVPRHVAGGYPLSLCFFLVQSSLSLLIALCACTLCFHHAPWILSLSLVSFDRTPSVWLLAEGVHVPKRP